MAGIGQLDDGEDEGEDDSLMEVADEGTRVVTNSTDFRVGQTFETNDDLSKKISEYERAHFVQLWKRDTKTVEAAQKMLSRTLSSRIKYYVLTYACIHGGRKFKARGEGKRSTQTFQKECPFELKLRASVDGNFLEVRDFNESHNHEITRELFKQLPTQRKLSAQEQASARHLLSLKANKKMVQDNLSADTGKVVLLKDLSNIMRRDTSDTRNNLNQTVKLLTEKFGASVELLLGENNVLFGVYFQDVQMKNILNSYPEVVCVDATYKLLELRFPVYIMLIEDGNGQSEIVAVFLLQEETEESISSVIDMFIRQNPASSKVRIIITDKDMTERDVLARKFPSAQLLICLFHTLRTFRREVTLEKMGITPGQRNLYLDLMQQMAYAASEEKYLEVYERFKDSAVPLVRQYFDTQWHSIRSQWVVGLKHSYGSFLNSTNNRVECINSKLKSVIDRYSSLEDFVEKFFLILRVMRSERDHRAIQSSQKVPVIFHTADPAVVKYMKLLTPYAFKYFSQQLALKGKVSLKTTDLSLEANDTNQIYEVTCSSGVTLNVSVNDCQCSSWTSMKASLPTYLSSER
ncbi:PREDICTED: protein FAR1-RELATED SEQUENCE 4-like [Amphimedon queenslandica]|uniref:MULE transposase domain-containing protein n=1 Tax=Amphimedon queenslandica TaxID=400682 RepID=A0AAN0JLX3_AMPQE|nr:PREDICTED: protein FAR1-RELATED SEQUENCE 4-like [Amphimedon queenslandica]|eukprot:XP_019858006.1 PREDICTED: protein FAR1-RELATED SEQUENCE 4-like [Amphimedon queenslandica]